MTELYGMAWLGCMERAQERVPAAIQSGCQLLIIAGSCCQQPGSDISLIPVVYLHVTAASKPSLATPSQESDTNTGMCVVAPEDVFWCQGPEFR